MLKSTGTATECMGKGDERKSARCVHEESVRETDDVCDDKQRACETFAETRCGRESKYIIRIQSTGMALTTRSMFHMCL